MNKRRSDTQYLFKVDLNRPASELHGVALLGHQTVADLHTAIFGMPERGARVSYSFRVGNEKVAGHVRLDELNLKKGQTVEYLVESAGKTRREIITVEFIEGE